MKRRSSEELDALYEKTKALIKDGMPAKAAMQKAGIASMVYYKRRAKEVVASQSKRKYTKRQINPKVLSIHGGEIAPTNKVFAFYGEPKTILDMMKELR